MQLLADANFLVALAAEGHGHHKLAKSWWADRPADEVMHICRPAQTAFLRLLVSEAALGEDAITLPEAWGLYAKLLVSRRFAFIQEPPGIDAPWAKLCRPFRKSPKVVADAYLAAFAMTAGCKLVTLDRAFSQFHGLSFVNPADSP